MPRKALLREIKPCTQCGQPIDPIAVANYPTQRFCSRACSQIGKIKVGKKPSGHFTNEMVEQRWKEKFEDPRYYQGLQWRNNTSALYSV